jgi:hypothetical protein
LAAFEPSEWMVLILPRPEDLWKAGRGTAACCAFHDVLVVVLKAAGLAPERVAFVERAIAITKADCLCFEDPFRFWFALEKKLQCTRWNCP